VTDRLKFILIITKGGIRLKKLRVEDAVGMKIGHDMTRIVPKEFKGAAFKKGHVITEEDIPVLKSMGKQNIYIGEIPEGYIHEDECAVRIAEAICEKENFELSQVSEGKINITTKQSGLLKIDLSMLYSLNNIEHIAISTLYNDIFVRKGERVASERIIPLYTKEENILKIEEQCSAAKLFYVKKPQYQKVHLIITGSEVYYGLIKDKFEETLRPKVAYYGCEIVKVVKVPDDKEKIKQEINNSVNEGADIILCSGGMSVDEDDLTPIAIKEEINELIVHGVPVQPGNMFLLGYKAGVPIMGIPGAVIFYDNTLFDVVFPRIACKEKLSKDFFIKLSLGGLCYFCNYCTYPNCTFGKGR
jgi:molybdenum cofactor synthesis domain-containing protein